MHIAVDASMVCLAFCLSVLPLYVSWWKRRKSQAVFIAGEGDENILLFVEEHRLQTFPQLHFGKFWGCISLSCSNHFCFKFVSFVAFKFFLSLCPFCQSWKLIPPSRKLNLCVWNNNQFTFKLQFFWSDLQFGCIHDLEIFQTCTMESRLMHATLSHVEKWWSVQSWTDLQFGVCAQRYHDLANLSKQDGSWRLAKISAFNENTSCFRDAPYIKLLNRCFLAFETPCSVSD